SPFSPGTPTAVVATTGSSSSQRPPAPSKRSGSTNSTRWAGPWSTVSRRTWTKTSSSPSWSDRRSPSSSVTQPTSHAYHPDRDLPVQPGHRLGLDVNAYRHTDTNSDPETDRGRLSGKGQGRPGVERPGCRQHSGHDYAEDARENRRTAVPDRGHRRRVQRPLCALPYCHR